MNGVRSFAPTVLVAALGTTFGSALVIAPGIVTEALGAAGLADLGPVRAILSVVGWLFLGIALYVGAIVTANTCATLIAGQTRIIALQRLVGATGATLRARITRTGLVVGVLGGLIGAVVGTGLSAVFVVVLRGNGFLPDTDYTLLPWELVLPVVAVVLATWGAFAAGSRRVLTVTPLEALSSSVEPSHDDVRSGTARKVWAIVLMAGGAALMLIGLAVSASSPIAVLPAALGGFVSFAGVAVGATIVMPPVLQLIGRIGSHDPVVLLAGRNAMRAPGRSSRATIGLVIGVTLLVTFAVALGIMQHVLEAQLEQMGQGQMTTEMVQAQRDFFVQLNAVVSVIVGFSAVIAAVGVVNALALGVLQRRRELGLLRVLGLTGAQVRRMIVTEAVQMVVAAVVSGLVLGTFYGWVGGQTLLGSLGHPVTPVLPPLTIGIVVVGALVLAVVATIAPVRRAMRVPPTEALAVD
ncbi:putative ABC transport system permease protein [Curtobacterium sp. PhB142]|uniref:ABC transporter permease n=1 Tax=unclassified Curtobacterium TaxID=257496 RepID=UPI000F499AAC|nr:MULTISPECIES: ABC transporter permease [unclassified Curtobacterium]ROS46222.1 putative ABC transport system permease protein [Curtobacterium sp. PhB78]TCL85122.1 putative ABC transport system permease protein [Curtobacterium sp. PhB142]TCM01947.1 putative ABC transport system permease protein [Curtobacterium sp. PhB134]TDW45739.1 putative ABC transport system permease protein [Curtobacterium sp. PhB42]TDW57881.1 putative ABC transport system permease protein [Curtobacterium sp. PhB190]